MGARQVRRPLALVALVAIAALPVGCECPDYESPCSKPVELLAPCYHDGTCTTDGKPDPCTNSCILRPSSVFAIPLDGIDLTSTPDLKIPPLTYGGCEGDTNSGRLTVDIDGQTPTTFVLDGALVFRWDPPLDSGHRLSIAYEGGPCVSFFSTLIDADCEAANPAPVCPGY